VLILSGPVFAQTNLGRISGSITDPSGAVIVGATITVIDVDRGVSRVLVTDSTGEYAAPSLTPGSNYAVRAEAKGFQRADQQNVQVPVGGDVRVDLKLQAGSQSQEVTVTSAPPMINLTNATVSSALEGDDVSKLPVLGGQWELLFELRPGIQSRPGRDRKVRRVTVTGLNKAFGCLTVSITARQPYSAFGCSMKFIS